MAVITTEPYTIDGEGITIDLILWRRFLAPTPGLLEQLLALHETNTLSEARRNCRSAPSFGYR